MIADLALPVASQSRNESPMQHPAESLAGFGHGQAELFGARLQRILELQRDQGTKGMDEMSSPQGTASAEEAGIETEEDPRSSRTVPPFEPNLMLLYQLMCLGTGGNSATPVWGETVDTSIPLEVREGEGMSRRWAGPRALGGDPGLSDVEGRLLGSDSIGWVTSSIEAILSEVGDGPVTLELLGLSSHDPAGVDWEMPPVMGSRLGRHAAGLGTPDVAIPSTVSILRGNGAHGDLELSVTQGIGPGAAEDTVSALRLVTGYQSVAVGIGTDTRTLVGLGGRQPSRLSMSLSEAGPVDEELSQGERVAGAPGRDALAAALEEADSLGQSLRIWEEGVLPDMGLARRPMMAEEASYDGLQRLVHADLEAQQQGPMDRAPTLGLVSSSDGDELMSTGAYVPIAPTDARHDPSFVEVVVDMFHAGNRAEATGNLAPSGVFSSNSATLLGQDGMAMEKIEDPEDEDLAESHEVSGASPEQLKAADEPVGMGAKTLTVTSRNGSLKESFVRPPTAHTSGASGDVAEDEVEGSLRSPDFEAAINEVISRHEPDDMEETKVTDQETMGSRPVNQDAKHAVRVEAPFDGSTQRSAHGVSATQRPISNHPVTSGQIVEQILERVELDMKGDYGEIRLQLKPEHLGELHVKITTDNGVISAAFMAESHTVKSLIEAGLPELRQQLMQQGLNIQDVSVQVGGHGAHGGESYAGGSGSAFSGAWFHDHCGIDGASATAGPRPYLWGNTIDFRA